jgi:hypothetical protein
MPMTGVDGVGGAGVALAGDRRDVHDRAAAARDHLAGDALEAEEHALAVDAHDAVPVRLGEVHDVRPPGDAGVVDEHVDPAEGGGDLADHPVDAGQVADVGGDRQAPPAPGRDAGGGLLGGGPVDVGDCHVRAGIGERQRRGVADPLAGAGDDRNPPAERAHALDRILARSLGPASDRRENSPADQPAAGSDQAQ